MFSDADPDGPPTLRVPVRPPLPVPSAQSPVPPGSPGSLATTPPPSSDLNLGGSEWFAPNEEAPKTRRSPRVGDTVAGFKIVGELGRGAFARVYLAQQEALAGRPVALKVTLRPTREAERLARLQHTNVVPVYSVHAAGPAQIICMPFLGRTTLADLIRAYRAEHPSRCSGRKSTSLRAAGRTTAFDSRKSHLGARSGTDSTVRSGTHRTPVWTWAADTPPPIIGDPRAVLEVVAQLASGLSHAHERGILHLDLKPANVLLADTGEPMLLDFNLSFDAAGPNRELVGGTMPYMAIEQLRDMRDRGKGVIDTRTDLYSLGVMAFEMLTGTVPFPTTSKEMREIDKLVEAKRAGPPALRALNPAVTPAVEAIVRKLLAPDPDDRYQSADDLRTDVERQLNDLPLRHARESSARERFRKWRRRNPGVLVRLLAACLIGLTIGLGAVAHRQQQATARTAAVEQARAVRTGLDTVRLDLVLPDDPKARARGVERANAVLALYGLPGDSNWRKRADVRLLPEAERTALAGDLGELLILLAHTKWQAAEALPESERRAAAAEAWKLNVAARTCFPADAVPHALDRQTSALAPAVGEQVPVPAIVPNDQPSDPRHLFLDAADALAHGRYAVAIPVLDRVVSAQPSHAAAQFCLAYCRQQAGQYQRALERYDAARVLLPADPRPAYYRGQIYCVTKKPAQAEIEFTKAIELAPESGEAYRHRAVARFRLATKENREKLAEAEADLNAALKHGAPALFVHLVRERVRAARGDTAGAAADREAAKGVDPKSEMDFFVRGWSRMESDPAGALADLKKAASINPRSLIALQNQVHVLADKLKDNDSALAVATKTAELYPEFAPAVAGRAVVLARLGQRDDAHKEIARARLLSEDAEVLYHAACVYSITSTTYEGDRAKAVELLRQALREGYSDLSALGTDRDLDPLRGLKEFKELQQSAVVFFR